MVQIRMREKKLSRLRRLYVAQRYNVLYYLSEFLGAIAYAFAVIAFFAAHELPGLSQIAEWRSKEFSEYSKAVRVNAIKHALYSSYEDIPEDELQQEPQVE